MTSFFHQMTYLHQIHNVTKTIIKPCAGFFWWKVGIKTLSRKLRFGALCCLMTGLLTIPYFNADSERDFSIL